MLIRHYLLCTVIVVLALTIGTQAQQDTPLDTIKIDTNLVVLRVAVNDQQGRAAISLKQDAFKLYEDGVEQQIGFFSAEGGTAELRKSVLIRVAERSSDRRMERRTVSRSHC